MNWHVRAQRLAAQQPWKPWSQICSELGRRPRKKRVTVKQVVERMEQLRLW